MGKHIKDSLEINIKPISNFLNDEVKQYAQYVIKTRTMPSIMDGLRVGARKILWATQVGDLKNKKFVKMPSLIGDSLKLQYSHGDASLANTIVNLCCEHTNKYHPLEAIGQIPSLRVPNCDTAVRYLMIRKTPNLSMFEVDKELLTIQNEEGEDIEPKYFLPIIPWLLLNRTSSPGFGFSYKSFSYDINDIIDNCILSISKGSCANGDEFYQLKPRIVGINDDNLIYNSNKNRWYNVGEYELLFDSDTLIVNDLPYDISFEFYEELLETFKEKNIITKWDNQSEGEKIKYIITLPKGKLKYHFDNNKWKFFQAFRLFSLIKEDILNCIDTDGKTILFFESPQDLIDAFIKRRLVYYEKRKTRTIKILEEKIQKISSKIKFINLVITGDIVVVDKKKDFILEQLVKYDIPDYVLNMKLWNLTIEEIEKLKEEKNELVENLSYIKSTSIQKMYINDLLEMKEKYSQIKTEQYEQ